VHAQQLARLEMEDELEQTAAVADDLAARCPAGPDPITSRS